MSDSSGYPRNGPRVRLWVYWQKQGMIWVKPPWNIKLLEKDKWKIKGWRNPWKLCASLPVLNPVAEVFASCSSGGSNISEVSGGPGTRAPGQFCVHTQSRPRRSPPYSSDLRFQNRQIPCEKVCCSSRQLRQNNIHRRVRWHRNMFNISPLWCLWLFSRSIRGVQG